MVKNIDINSKNVQESTKFYKILLGAIRAKMFENNMSKPREKKGFMKGWSAELTAAKR